MPIAATVQNEQTVRVGVTGPEDVTTLRIISGTAQCFLAAGAGANTATSHQGTFSVLLGPTLTPAQFRKATATAALSALQLQGDGSLTGWSVNGVDADYDDDSGRVELTFDLNVQTHSQAAGFTRADITAVGFQVVILSTA